MSGSPEARIAAALAGHRAAVEALAADPALTAQIARVAGLVADALATGGRLWLFGNGGSAADAQHLAAELVGRFLVERRALPAAALTVDTSALTALGNDYGYETVFARQVEAHVRPGDVVVGITTSGSSLNVALGLQAARRIGAATVALTGSTSGSAGESADECIKVPTSETPRIQECHILIGHILCDLVEQSVTA